MQNKKNWAETAKEALQYFTRDTRNDKTEFWATTNDAPGWVKDLCYAAHKVDDVLPNDFIYEYIVDALDLIAEADGAERYSEIEEDIFSIEGDIYNADLLRWVASNLTFSAYVDQAIEEYGIKGHFEVLQLGNALHKQAIAARVLQSIDQQADEMEE